MTILIFILVLVALIVVHELGHFVAAKLFGMRVDEFGIGYPPRAATLWKHNGTEYTLNWLPFGGFVKIYGEDGDEPQKEETPASVEKHRGEPFNKKPYWQQAVVLVAGIAMNILFAWVLLTGTLLVGMPRALSDAERMKAPDAALMVANVLEKSPASLAGLKEGDRILKASYEDKTYLSNAPDEAFTTFIAQSNGAPITLEVERTGETFSLTVRPDTGIVPSEPERFAIGVAVGAVGTVPVSLLEAPIEGAKLTAEVTTQVALGLFHFFSGLFTFSADLSQVSGPVGIAGAVGEASATSIVALLSLTAVISINLALINLLPVPALDGGRLLFVIIESITRRPIPAGIAGTLNTVGFALLILLMLVVTANDVWKAFI